MPKTTYQCNHCFHTEPTMEKANRHEAHCPYNPEVRGCITCGHHCTSFNSYCGEGADAHRVDGLTCPEVQGCPRWMPILED